MDSLREKVAREILRFDVPAGARGLNAGQTADNILAIPEIKEALRLKAINDSKVGYERQG